MKTRKLRIKRKVVVKSRKKGKLNRKISNRRKQRKSMMCRRTQQNKYRRHNLKKRFSRKISVGGLIGSFFTKQKPSEEYVSFESLLKAPPEASKPKTINMPSSDIKEGQELGDTEDDIEGDTEDDTESDTEREKRRFTERKKQVFSSEQLKAKSPYKYTGTVAQLFGLP